MACRWQPGMKITALLDALNSALAEPFALAWSQDSPRFLLVFTVIYAVVVIVAVTDQKNTRPGAEHGSAAWGDVFRLNKFYMDRHGSNLLLTQHFHIGIDGYKHMLSEAGSNAENMAHAYRIPIPDIKKQLIAFAVIPILIVVGTYIPQYIKGKQAMDQRIAASAKQVEIVKKALEPVCVRVHADNPNESRSRSSYTVMGYLRDSGATDCYVHVQVNNSGTIINISYVEGVDINKSLEENLMQTEKDFATLQKSFENLNVSVSNPEILSYQAIPQQFKDEFLNGTFYKSFRFYDQDAPISLSCSFDTETEDQFDEYTRPKIYFFLGSK